MMDTRSAVDALKAMYNTLSPTERTIADFIIHNSLQTTTMTVSELSEKCGTSDASIVRLAQKLGYSGYYDLKLSLVSTISRGDAPASLESGPFVKNGSDLIERTVSQSVRNLTDTAKKLDRKIIERVVEMIDRCSRLALFAAGNSTTVVLDAAYKFSILGKSVVYGLSPEMAMVSARQLEKDDLAIAISHSGSSRLPTHCLSIARNRGVHTVAITNYETSPLTKVSEVNLVTAVHDSILPNDFVVTRLTETLVIDILFFLLARRRNTDLETILTDSETALSEFKM